MSSVLMTTLLFVSPVNQHPLICMVMLPSATCPGKDLYAYIVIGALNHFFSACLSDCILIGLCKLPAKGIFIKLHCN